MKLYLPAIIISALLLTLSACKSEQDKAMDAWLKIATEHVDIVTAMLRENDLPPVFGGQVESEQYYKAMKEDLDKLKAGPTKSERKKDMDDLKTFVETFGGDSKDVKKEQDTYLPMWRRRMQERIIHNQKTFAMNCDIKSGRVAAIKKAGADASSAFGEMLPPQEQMQARFDTSMTNQGYLMGESKEWEPTDKTKAGYAKIREYILNVVVPSLEFKKKS